MSDLPVQVVVAAFANEQGADDALRELERAQDDRLITIRDASIIQRDDQGMLHLENTTCHGVGRGAVVGGVAGAIVGLLTGPVGWATGGGAVIGALASRLRESGFPDEKLQQVADTVRPGTSALVVVIDKAWLPEVAGSVAETAHEVVTYAITADMASQLEAGRDVAYTAFDIDDRIVIARLAADEHAAATERVG